MESLSSNNRDKIAQSRHAMSSNRNYLCILKKDIEFSTLRLVQSLDGVASNLEKGLN